jgi:hypothetical protein
MFSKAIQSIRAKQCILPQAITPLQKSVCVLTGLVTLGFSSYILYKGFGFMCEHRRVTNESNYSVSTTGAPSSHGKEIWKKINMVKIADMLIMSLMGIIDASLIYGLFYTTREAFRDLRRTTQCCNIVRGTIFYAISAPTLSMIILFWSFLTIAIYDEKMAQKIGRRINTSLNEFYSKKTKSLSL